MLRRLHKFALSIKAIIAPELIAVEGLQEWSQAQRMVRICAASTREGFKLVHAFYIGMLALRYKTPHGDRVIWPNQYAWLLQEGLIDWNDHASWGLSEEIIHDKSNADGTAKILALGQVSWFAAQSIMRRAHMLPLSQLEAMTLSYIPLFAITYLFWWIKPKDVLTPSTVSLPAMSEEQRDTFESMAVSRAFDDEHTGNQDSLWSIWYLTPRVFEKESEQKALEEEQRRCEQSAEHGPTLIRLRRAINLEDAMTAERKEIVVANWDPELYRSKFLWPLTCLFGASFGALHLISWNTDFPTSIEQWLWRAAALASIVSILVFMQFEKVVVRWGGPLTLISLISPIVYLFSRVVMMGGVIAAFRAQSLAIYDTYVVSTYWIHIV
ncbi:MAG: hypothetical protein Q9195_007083 [Heterodermia aff. obscurata]